MTKNQKIIASFLIVIILGLFIFYFLSKPKSSPPLTPAPLTDQERIQILQKVSNISPANPKMTDEQRMKLLNKTSLIIKK